MRFALLFPSAFVCVVSIADSGCIVKDNIRGLQYCLYPESEHSRGLSFSTYQFDQQNLWKTDGTVIKLIAIIMFPHASSYLYQWCIFSLVPQISDWENIDTPKHTCNWKTHFDANLAVSKFILCLTFCAFDGTFVGCNSLFSFFLVQPRWLFFIFVHIVHVAHWGVEKATISSAQRWRYQKMRKLFYGRQTC